MSKSTTPRPKPEFVLIAKHGDGFLEVFAEKHVRVKIVDVPHCPGSEILAEDTLEQSLPRTWRKLYYPGKVRATDNARPLSPTTLAASVGVNQLLTTLNGIGATA